MTVQTLWSASFDDGATQATLTFDDATLLLDALSYQNLRGADYKMDVSYAGSVVNTAPLPMGTPAESIDLSSFNLPVVATAMDADDTHPSPWTMYELPLGWSVSLGLSV